MRRSRVVVTGYGMVSALGNSFQATWGGLFNGKAPVGLGDTCDGGSFPYRRRYPIVRLDATGYVEQKDVRAMGVAMLYGTVAAGMAIESARLRGHKALREAALFVAAATGERDSGLDRDVAIELSTLTRWRDRANQLLYERLRPSLFLAQLPNLAASNVSIVYGIEGSSTTFIGEHAAGGNALAEAVAALSSGEKQLALVGGGHNSEQYERRLAMAGTGFLSKDRSSNDRRPVDSWGKKSDGTIMGSVGAFLVLETEDHASSRRAPIRAELSHVSINTRSRDSYKISASLRQQFDSFETPRRPDVIVGQGSGVPEVDTEELDFVHSFDPLDSETEAPCITTATPMLGNVMEQSLVVSTILATAVLESRRCFPTYLARKTATRAMTSPVDYPAGRRQLRSALAVSLGLGRSESLALLTRCVKGAHLS